MPNSQLSTDPGKPRLRGDMYLRAEQRHRAESSAAQVTGIVTPAVPAVYEAPSPVPEPGPASTPESVTLATTAVGPVSDRTRETIVTTAAEAPPEAKPASTAVSNGAATEAANVQNEAEYQWVAAEPLAVPISRQRQLSKRSVAPAMVLSSVAVAGVFAIVLMLSPAPSTEQPEFSASAPTTAAVDTNRAAPSSRVAATTGTQPEVADTLPAAVAQQPPGRPARVPAAVAKPVVHASRTEGPAVTPVHTAGEGQLRVTSTPSGARVTVNGIGWGQTPLTIGHLPLGTKTVRITRDGYAAQQRTVDLHGEGAAAALSVTLKRTR